MRTPGRSTHRGLLRIGGRVHPCVLGSGGISVRKHEGDGATPSGDHAVLGGYRKPVRHGFGPATRRLRNISPQLGWCDAPGHASYNRPVRLPFAASHEAMLRQDRLYDVVLVLDWNVTRRARNRGSAIFMHLTRPDGGPTQGCIGIDPKLMRHLLPHLLEGVRIRVLP